MSKPIALQGAVVAITGGARGIGLAIAEAMTAAGARVSGALLLVDAVPKTN